MPNEKQKRLVRTLFTYAAFGALAILTSGCVVDPYPPPPPAAVAAPGYYGGPYSYYDYPPYYGPAYYGVYGPPVGVAVGIGGRGWHGGWR